MGPQDGALLVPVAKHDAPVGAAINVELVDRRAVGVTVDQGVDAEAAQGLFHGGRRGVGDRLHGAGVLHLTLAGQAGSTGLLGERQAGLQRLREHVRTPVGIADLGADLLVFHVVGAQQIAVHQQHRLAVQLDHGGIRQQAHACFGGVVPAEHEVAVAVHEEHRHAAGGQRGELCGHECAGF